MITKNVIKAPKRLVLSFIGASLLTLSVSVYAGPFLNEPPEPRATFNQFDFPEVALRRQYADAEERRFREPIRDNQGRIRYIIDFTANATDLYSSTPPAFDDLAEWERPQMRNLARAIGNQYGFKPLLVTSWVGNSIVAHLTEAQVGALKSDPRVTAITTDVRIKLSAALWYDWTGPQGQYISWGTNAVGGYWGYTAPNDNVRVYIIDSGVGLHVDLPNVIERYSFGGTFTVGCYSHATHVAGIVGATGATSMSAYGVNRGVKMVSISINTFDDVVNQCATIPDFTTAGHVAAALSLAKLRITETQKMGVVNISSNSTAYRYNTTIGAKIREVTTTGVGYPGALVVMSAGNKLQSNCEETYEYVHNSDGVIVVGGMDANGQQVVTCEYRVLEPISGSATTAIVGFDPTLGKAIERV